jgi:hypothetical protein
MGDGLCLSLRLIWPSEIDLKLEDRHVREWSDSDSYVSGAG